MANILRDEEQNHIITEMSRLNMSFELANIFISIDSMNIEELFKYKYQQNYKFYFNVFKELYRYTYKKLEEFRIDEVIKNIFDKIQCEYYTTKKMKNGFIDENFLTSHFIESVFNLILNKGYDNNYIIKILYSLTLEKSVNPLVFKEIILRNPSLINAGLLYEIISNNIFSDEDLIDVIIESYKIFDNETLDGLISNLYSDKESLLAFTRSVMKRFIIMSDVINKSKDKVIVKTKVCPISKNRNEKECLLYLRKFLSDIIYSDAELDVIEFLTEAYNRLKTSNKLIAESILKYTLWLSSEERRKNRVANYLKYNCEEGDMWTYEDYENIINTLQVKEYIADLSILNDYLLFLRVFNINRFFLFQYTSVASIQYRIKWSYEHYEYFINNAFDVDLYIFLNIDK